ncbi:MAG: ATP-binding cassette domain-containing protein [Halieaceae bacterium]
MRNISLRRGAKILLEEVDLTIQPGQHLALTGANGSGKSSLFALLLGELGADTGEIEGLASMRLAAMAQEVELTQDIALDYLIGGDAGIAAIRARLKAAEAEEDYERAGQLHLELEAANGYDIERRAELMLLGLGFASGDHLRPVNDFSGGWRIRLNLGRALMAPSELLLLDEPTNHLDLDATLWLQQWLKAYAGTLILISHDREFIDATCQQVLHIEHSHIQAYRGNYSSFESQRAERLANQQASYEKQQRRIAEIDDFVRRFRYKATKARQAQSRIKELERMHKIAPAHVDSPFTFSFLEPERASDPILQLSDASLGYGDQPILNRVNLALGPGSRLGLLGKNGAGKSTLLKSLMGQLPLLSGERTEGAHCHIGYFDQHQLEALDLEASAAVHLQRLRPDAREQEIYDFIGGFNFHGDVATTPIAPFSGGEKTRLALAMVVWQQPNLLIMDEPTNHLDMEMRHSLTMALQTYQGAVIVVTHDRHLLRNTVDELLLVHDGEVEEYEQDVSAYESWVLSQQSGDGKPSQRTSAEPNRKEQRKAAAQRREQMRPLRRNIERTERQMAEIEEGLAALELKLADTTLYEAERKADLELLLLEQGRLRQQAGELEESWIEFQHELEELEQAPQA